MAAKTLRQKRRQAIWAIAGYTLGSGIATGAPTPILEAPKQVIMTAADFAMCAHVYKIYFDEEIDNASVTEMLLDFGLVASVGAGLGYAMSRGVTFLLSEITNPIPVIGWAFAGLLSGTVTGAFGLTWMGICETTFKSQHKEGLATA